MREAKSGDFVGGGGREKRERPGTKAMSITHTVENVKIFRLKYRWNPNRKKEIIACASWLPSLVLIIVVAQLLTTHNYDGSVPKQAIKWD